jgi:hypothetical protein
MHGAAPRRTASAATDTLFAGRCEAIFRFVTSGHSRSKNGVASLAYDPVVHAEVGRFMDSRIKSR